MLSKIYSVYDLKAEAFITPFFLPNDAIAIRPFTDCVTDEKHAFAMNPFDYAMYRLGQFDDLTGELISDSTLLLEAKSLTNTSMHEEVVELTRKEA